MPLLCCCCAVVALLLCCAAVVVLPLLLCWCERACLVAAPGVDTFFFLSGFLSSYVGLKKMRGKNPPVIKSVLGYILDRWLRKSLSRVAVLL